MRAWRPIRLRSRAASADVGPRNAFFRHPKGGHRDSKTAHCDLARTPRHSAPARNELICIGAGRTLRCGVPITPRLSRKLHQTLGGQEGAEFVNWMNQMDARASDVATHGDLAELRAELRADIAELRQEMRVGFVQIHEEMAHLEIRFERRFSDLIKWSFVFWVGAVGAIAALAGVLR